MVHPPKSQQYPVMLTSSTRKPGVQRPVTSDGSSAKAMNSSHALFPKLHLVLVLVKDKISKIIIENHWKWFRHSCESKRGELCVPLRATGRLRNHLEGPKVTVNKFIAGFAARSATHSYRKWPANSTGHPCILCTWMLVSPVIMGDLYRHQHRPCLPSVPTFLNPATQGRNLNGISNSIIIPYMLQTLTQSPTFQQYPLIDAHKLNTKATSPATIGAITLSDVHRVRAADDSSWWPGASAGECTTPLCAWTTVAAIATIPATATKLRVAFTMEEHAIAALIDANLDQPTHKLPLCSCTWMRLGDDGANLAAAGETAILSTR